MLYHNFNCVQKESRKGGHTNDCLAVDRTWSNLLRKMRVLVSFRHLVLYVCLAFFNCYQLNDSNMRILANVLGLFYFDHHVHAVSSLHFSVGFASVACCISSHAT